MIVLGIESSADETAAAIVEDGRNLLSNVISSSIDLQVAYGGIVPEIAARSHLEVIIPVIEEALLDAKVTWDDIDAIAVTKGPGLLGSLLIGALTARTLATAKNKPLYGVNHVLAHIYGAFLTSTALPGFKLPKNQPEFPFLALIVSGGHTQLVFFKNHFDYKILGQTLDDAVGEAFDKVAKMLGLPYPGGPSIQAAAKNGNPKAFEFPKAKLEEKYDFSFSGPKTAVLRVAQHASGHDFTFPSSALPEALNEAQKCDIAASFQRSALETLILATKEAELEYKPKNIVIAGGVAANQELRRQAAINLHTPVIYPDIKLCTDNAAMVASLGYYQSQINHTAIDPYTLQVQPSLTM